MKHFIIILIFCQFLFVLSAQPGQKFTPPEYPDDYSSVAGLNHMKKWGYYNVHDPSCIKGNDGYYYLYSTDAIYFPKGEKMQNPEMKIGNIMVRRSRDLVHWKFMGWAFNNIPKEALEYVKKVSGGFIPTGIWAPYIEKYHNIYRLYFAVSIFGKNTSYIGLAESHSPLGPWTQKGCVVKTKKSDIMNAIDPTVATNIKNEKQWMIYGSFFGGIYTLQLNPLTGLAKIRNDKGFCVARRANGDSAVIEAPEVIYNPQFKKYYLFVSYDPLLTTYNIRVGRSDKPQGPYYDINGIDMANAINHKPVITYAYRFSGHPGWAGVGHCGVLNDHGVYFMFHQGRLAPTNLMMDLHVRRIFWTPDGWPVVSPERYAAVPQTPIYRNDLLGQWETIQLRKIVIKAKIWRGQFHSNNLKYDTLNFNNSRQMVLFKNGTVQGEPYTNWVFRNGKLKLYNHHISCLLLVSKGWDWERKRLTLVFTGIGINGYSLWGKKIYKNH